MVYLHELYYTPNGLLPSLGLLAEIESSTPVTPKTRLNKRFRPDGGEAGSGRYVNRWVSGNVVVESPNSDDDYLCAGRQSYSVRSGPYYGEEYRTELGIVIADHPRYYYAEGLFRENIVSGRIYDAELRVILDIRVDEFLSLQYPNGRAWYTGYNGRGKYIEVPAHVSATTMLAALEKDFAMSLRQYDPPRRYIIPHRRSKWENISPEPKLSAEMDDFHERVDLLPHFGLDGAMAAAFTNAVDNMPNIDSMNNIANALDLLKLLGQTLAMVVGGNLTGLGSLGDAWLGYRYAYKTTLSDVTGAMNVLNRLLDLSRASEFRSNGDYREGEWYVRAVIHLETDFFTTIRSRLEKYSLGLTPYNMWDLVPYSFIVDWFLDVGGLLELYGSRNIALRFKEQGAWFSIERRWENEYGLNEVYYYRFFDTPNLAYVARESHGSKAVTWLKRSLDVLALFT